MDSLHAALITLSALPRLRSLDFACSAFMRVDRPMAVPQLQPANAPIGAAAASLTALNVAAVFLRANHMRMLVAQLPQLRTLRYRPAGQAAECLRPLTSLPRLADLGLVASALEWNGRAADFSIVAECSALRRLALSGAALLQCLPLLLAPGLHRLRELSLTDLRWDAERPPEWANLSINLHALCRLTLDRCGRADVLVAAVAAGSFPRLRRLRIAPAILTHTNSWSAALCWRPRGSLIASPLADEIGTLLERRPEVRIELRIGFGMAGVAASWLLPLRSECDWLTALPQWTDFEVLHPLRHKFCDQPLLFVDAELGFEAPLDEVDED